MKMVFDLGHCSPTFVVEGNLITKLKYTHCTPGRKRETRFIPYEDAVSLVATNSLLPSSPVAVKYNNQTSMSFRKVFRDFTGDNIPVTCYRNHYSNELIKGIVDVI